MRILFFSVFVMLLQTLHTSAQSKSSMVIGNWSISKWEDLNTDPNKHTMLDKNSKDKIVTFKKDNKCETTQLIDGKKQIMGSGYYNISEDGKTFFQDKQQYEIVSLEQDEFAIRVQPELIIHFKRVADNK